jgi:hypothetical protein
VKETQKQLCDTNSTISGGGWRAKIAADGRKKQVERVFVFLEEKTRMFLPDISAHPFRKLPERI